MDRQALEPHQPRSRLVVLPRRGLHRSAPAHRPTAGPRALRPLHGLHGGVPDGGHRRPLSGRRAPVHLLPDHRAPRPHPRGAPAARRQPHLRLRRLPARLPLEPLCTVELRARFRPPPRPRRATAHRPVFLERDRVRQAHRGLGHPPHWLFGLVAQCRRGARQRPDRPGGGSRPWRAVHPIPRIWCASTCSGRCPGMARRAPELMV